VCLRRTKKNIPGEEGVVKRGKINPPRFVTLQVLGSLGAAVLRSQGSRDEGRGKSQEEAVGRVKGKVCFGSLLLDDPCS